MNLDDIYDHPAVILHGSGVQAEVLANFVEVLARYTGERVCTVGKDNYDSAVLSGVERKDIATLKQDALEEIADAIFYLSAIAAKILALPESR